MKKIYSLFLMITGWFSGSAQQQGTERYKDSIFTSLDRITVEYGSNINYTGQKETLLADIFSPSNDSLAKRPIIIYAHGGGFRAGRRTDTACVELCKKLAKKGYVTASIDYRVGISGATSKEQFASVLRAVQDMNAFIRYVKANADSLKVDTSKVLLTGSSAGAITALTKAYMKIDSTAESLGVTSLQDLEGTTNELPFNTSVKAVFSMWGALYNLEWLQKNDIPVGCVHSEADSTVPYVSGYNRQNKTNMLFGSKLIYERAVSLGIPTFLHAYNSGKHDLGLKVAPYKDTTAQLIADFFYSLLHSTVKEDAEPLSDPSKQARIEAINTQENKHAFVKKEH